MASNLEHRRRKVADLTRKSYDFPFDPSQQKHQEALINAIAEMTGLGSEIKMQEGRYAILMK